MVTRPGEGHSALTIVRTVTIAVLTLVVLYAVYLVRHVLVLVVVAAFFAIGLDPAVRRLERLNLRRGQAVALIFLAAIGFIVAFALAVIPPLVRQVTNFATDLPEYVQD